MRRLPRQCAHWRAMTCRWHVFSLRSRRLCRRSIHLDFHRAAKADILLRRAGRVARPYKYPPGFSCRGGRRAQWSEAEQVPLGYPPPAVIPRSTPRVLASRRALVGTNKLPRRHVVIPPYERLPCTPRRGGRLCPPEWRSLRFPGRTESSAPTTTEGFPVYCVGRGDLTPPHETPPASRGEIRILLLHCVMRNRLPRRFAPRNDRLFCSVHQIKAEGVSHGLQHRVGHGYFFA